MSRQHTGFESTLSPGQAGILGELPAILKNQLSQSQFGMSAEEREMLLNQILQRLPSESIQKQRLTQQLASKGLTGGSLASALLGLAQARQQAKGQASQTIAFQDEALKKQQEQQAITQLMQFALAGRPGQFVTSSVNPVQQIITALGSAAIGGYTGSLGDKTKSKDSGDSMLSSFLEIFK